MEIPEAAVRLSPGSASGHCLSDTIAGINSSPSRVLDIQLRAKPAIMAAPRTFVNYPTPREAPATPYVRVQDKNPPMRGLPLLIGSALYVKNHEGSLAVLYPRLALAPAPDATELTDMRRRLDSISSFGPLQKLLFSNAKFDTVRDLPELDEHVPPTFSVSLNALLFLAHLPYLSTAASCSLCLPRASRTH